jgi:Outer membrane protein beta-barrel domain
MKKMFLIVAMMICCTLVFSQKTTRKALRMGFMIDPNISWLRPAENGITSNGAKFRMGYGLMIDYEFTENYIFNTGLRVAYAGGNLTYKGNKWSNNFVGVVAADSSRTTNAADYSIRLQYLEIPFALKFRAGGSGNSKAKFWGSFGGFVGVPLKARADVSTNFKVGGVANYAEDNFKINNSTQPVNLGMQVGAGVEYDLNGKNTFVAGLVFNNGFLDVTRNGSWGGDGRVNLNGLALKLGVFF